MGELISKRETAKRMGVSEQTVDKYRHKGILQAQTIGWRVMFDAEHVDQVWARLQLLKSMMDGLKTLAREDGDK